jgi:uncharacterized membrane protein
VPAVVVGSEILIGSDQIDTRLSALIEAGIGAGGVPFPDIDGMQAAVAYIESFRTGSTPSSDAAEAHDASPQAASWFAHVSQYPVESGLMGGVLVLLIGSPILAWARKRRSYHPAPNKFEYRVIVFLSIVGFLLVVSLLDLPEGLSTGNAAAGLAAILLLGLAVASGRAMWRQRLYKPHFPQRFLLLLAGAGLAIAYYMLRSEVGAQEPYCGPIGDCIAVQQSAYALLFGWLPVGALGIVGYMLLGAAWTIASVTAGYINRLANRALYLLLLFGVLFSAYLTVLELFVIQAMCAWCLTSALIMLLMFWVYSSHPPETTQPILDNGHA